MMQFGHAAIVTNSVSQMSYSGFVQCQIYDDDTYYIMQFGYAAIAFNFWNIYHISYPGSVQSQIQYEDTCYLAGPLFVAPTCCDRPVQFML